MCYNISNSTDLLENVKPMENVRLSDKVKAMDNVKPFDSVKLSDNQSSQPTGRAESETTVKMSKMCMPRCDICW